MEKENKRHAPDGKTCTVPALHLSHDLEEKEKGKLYKGKRMIFERKRKRIDMVLTLFHGHRSLICSYTSTHAHC